MIVNRNSMLYNNFLKEIFIMQVNNISSVSFAGKAKPKAVVATTELGVNPDTASFVGKQITVEGAAGTTKTTLRQKLGSGVKAVKTAVSTATEKATNAAKRTGKFIQDHTPKKLVGFFEVIGSKAKTAAKSVYSIAKKPFVVGLAATAALVTAGVVAATKLFSKDDEAELSVETI